MKAIETISEIRAEKKAKAIKNIEQIKTIVMAALGLLLINCVADIAYKTKRSDYRRFEKLLIKANLKYDNPSPDQDYKAQLRKLISKDGFSWDMNIDHPYFDDDMTLNQIADSGQIPFCDALKAFRDETLGE